MAILTSPAVISGLTPSSYRPHSLHGEASAWPETNCYIDLWIEILHALGLDPIALLPFCLAVDFEGDQWTFAKPSLDDIWTLYQIDVQELNLFESLADHIATQVARGRLPLVEVDSYYLPDTAGIAYQIDHSKTTIAINAIDIPARQLAYFHNSGYYTLNADDFTHILRLDESSDAVTLPPYAEFVKIDRRVAHEIVRAESFRIARRHLVRIPKTNPIAAWRPIFARDFDRLLTQPEIGRAHV